MPYFTMAVAMPLRRRKQSDKLAATLYSPPETCTSKLRALRKGMTPGSRRWTRAPRERKSRAQASLRIVRGMVSSPRPNKDLQMTIDNLQFQIAQDMFRLKIVDCQL